MMESWFHADKDALEGYYRSGFRKAALKPNPNVEEIAKQDLIDGLKAATKETTKGKYHKTKHAPAILQSISPALVRKSAPNCERLFSELYSTSSDRDRPGGLSYEVRRSLEIGRISQASSDTIFAVPPPACNATPVLRGPTG